MSYSYPIKEFHESLKRAFINEREDAFIMMDGHTALRNKFLSQSWNYFVEEKLISTKTVGDEQDTFIKGYITPKGLKVIKSL